MKIIIAGAGEVGTHLAKMLSNEDQDIILLDSDQARLDIIDANYNLMTWNGSTSSFQTLRDIGVDSTDLYIAVTPYETRNITACSIAHQLGAKKTVARIDNYEFMQDANREILKDMGVDFLIYPENLGALEIGTALEHNWARYWGELAEGQLMLIGVKLHAGTPLVGCYLRALPLQDHFFHIAAIKRNHETIIPKGDDLIKEEDIVYFIISAEDIDRLRSLCGKVKHNIKKVMIMGGSRITTRFALQYHGRYHIKIIESDKEVCENLATRLPDCEIVYGDGRDLEVLKENNFSDYDAFMGLTDSSETNILACLTAKEAGVPKTIADIEKIQFISQAEKLNIGTIINKKLLASSRIFKIMLDADESSAKFLALADADVAQLLVKPGAKITKGPVRTLKLPYGMTLAAVVHNGHCTLVGGNTQIEEGDSVVVFCLAGSIHKIEKWFN